MAGTHDSVPLSVRRRDDEADRTVLLRASALVAAGYGVGASFQAAYIYTRVVPGWDDVALWQRLTANVVGVVVLVAALAAVRVHRARSGWAVAAGTLAAATLMAVVRTLVQVMVGVYPADDVAALRAELLAAVVAGAVSAGIGVWVMLGRRSARRRTRAAERDAVAVEHAVRALEDEEIRIRRQVAEGLHGTLQQRLVLVDAHLAEVEARRRTSDAGLADELAWVRRELAQIRDDDVRQMSRLLYPDRLELGLVPAVRALLGRLPATIATSLHASEAMRALDDPTRSDVTVPERLLALRVVEEAVTNALKHGPASRVDVRLDVEGAVLHIVVANDGAPYAPRAVDPVSGTSRLAQRLAVAGGRLRVGPGADVGVRVEAHLPLGVGTP
ncbi:sensor histidine kinase [Cellulomonas shaoxiangyii]|uniref:histidine kinase n=1 Tax=Cellulomonas shaoxiangyii TaxID=2566013 RepID=A0A4P7SJW9_9CELL|nr:ATP-binding protein [Cellulomonas shaoxiangyii]QCB94579.1 ATP-binding protein [Cellulomonas shaoxiangyii]TGY85015.1 ATP-binding protein [Cellulomonas shaoxiangyii]